MDQILAGAGLGGSLGAGGSGDGGLLVAPEAERMIASLRAFPVEDVGSPEWTRQRECLERLNVQAHHNAVTHSDEFVKEFLVSHDKLGVLVHELLVVEAWRDRVFPHFGPDAMDSSLTNTQVYLAHFHEATLCNLLEIAFFHQDACEAAGDDALLELTDYCARKLVYLNAPAGAEADARASAEYVDRDAKTLLEQKPHEEFLEKAAEIRFGAACCALTVLRYLTDRIDEVPLCVTARLLDTHDAQMLLVPLLERRPWARRRKNPKAGAQTPAGRAAAYVSEVFEGGRWVERRREDRLQLTKCDGQVWLALNNLATDRKCRAKYRYDDHRKGTMERVKRHFNEVLFDQIPPLRDLQRVIDEILLSVAPASHEVTQGRLILEQVPETRERILRRSDAEWVALAKTQLETHFADTPEARRHAMGRMEDMSAMFEFMMEMEDRERASSRPPPEDPPAPPGAVRVDVSREAEDGEWYPWHAYEMRIDPAAPTKRVELASPDGSGFGVSGERVKLRAPEPPPPPDSNRNAKAAEAMRKAREASAGTPAPHNGKIVATFGKSRAEALLDLPAPGKLKADVGGATMAPEDEARETAEANDAMAELPSAMWVTVGLLARDGFALQVKLKRCAKAHEAYRCQRTGLFWVYEPAGGFLTVLDAEKKKNTSPS
jgi:hypothetical protein